MASVWGCSSTSSTRRRPAGSSGEVGAPVDVEVRSGHVGVGHRGAEGHHLCDLGRISDSSEVHRGAVALRHDAVGIVAVSGVTVRRPDRSLDRAGEDRARSNGVHEYSVHREATGQILRDAGERRLARRIPDQSDALVLHGDRSDIDNPAPRSPA